MRSFVLALMLAAPALARADLRLVSSVFDGGAPAAPAHLDLPQLRLDADASLVIDDGGGAGHHRYRSGVEPVLALILGIIPGFGLGHLIAESPRFVMWLVIDVVLLAVGGFGFWGPHYLDPYPLGGVFGLLVLVERVIEGIDAFHQAGGSFADLGPPLDDVRVALNVARPVRDPALVVARF